MNILIRIITATYDATLNINNQEKKYEKYVQY